MTYQETLEFLFAQLPMYQRSGAAAYKNDLSTTLALDEYFGQPHREYKNIHIAGTNGKGSVSHMLASVLQQAGFKVGLYTSPHYRDFRERIKINGQMIPEEEVIVFTETHYPAVEHLKPSFFEMTFAMATDYFRLQNVDVAIWETGMGGRLDSTNVVTPEVAAITNIALDHTRFLGNTVAAIAAEKAGIIKRNIPVVIGQKQPEAQDVFLDFATQMNAPLSFASEEILLDEPVLKGNGLLLRGESEGIKDVEITMPFLARYQVKNLKTVLQIIKLLNQKRFDISIASIQEGIRNVTGNTGFMGRFQLLKSKPLTIADSGHNPAGVEEVMQQINELGKSKLHMVIGMVNDKDIRQVLSLMPQQAAYYFAKADIPRGLAAVELQQTAMELGLKGNVYASVTAALDAALEAATDHDLVFVGGSTFTVAEVV
jgi:dihydrofolate synthase/folylpolyglutamate synthase